MSIDARGRLHYIDVNLSEELSFLYRILYVNVFLEDLLRSRGLMESPWEVS